MFFIANNIMGKKGRVNITNSIQDRKGTGFPTRMNIIQDDIV